MRKVLYIYILSFLFSGTTGKIKGFVFDGSNSEPLVGCNIMIDRTSIGTATDINGQFLIIDIPPGKYNLNVTMIGYSNYIVNDFEVNSDLTTEFKIPMKISSIKGSEVVVNAKQNLINKNLTSTTAIITSDNIDKLPVTEVSEIMNLQAGFVDGHLRGGRSGEIAYWVDGIPVTDQYDGNSVIDVSKDMIQEMQLISGAFNAEYGQAMSGILNIITKEGTDDFGGNINTYSGDFFSSKSNFFLNLDNFNPLTTKNMTINLHGKVTSKIYYYLNLRNIYYQGVYEGKRVFNPNSYGVEMNYEGENIWHVLGSDELKDYQYHLDIMESRNIDDDDTIEEMYNMLRNVHIKPLGNGKHVPMDWNQKKYFQLNTIWKINNKTKLKMTLINDNVDYQDYDRMYKYNPDGNLNRKRVGGTKLLQLKQFLNETSFFTLGLTSFKKTYSHKTFDDFNLYVHDKMNETADNYSFYSGGSNNSQFNRSTITQTLKFDYTNQINSENMIKFGYENRNHKVNYENIYLQPTIEMTNIDPIYESSYLIGVQIPHDSTMNYSQYEFTPIEHSAYIQDKIELDEFIMNIGLRVDYFNSNGRILSDPSDPSIYNPIKPQNRYHDDNNNGTQDEGERNVTIAERLTYWYKDATPKTMISPRFGASFPFSDQGVFHFSYGHFFQIPSFELLFHNSDFDLSQSTGNVGIVGNADLKPEKTISYELGFKYQFNPFTIVDATFYCRDIRDLTGTRTEEISMFGGASTYSRYENSDFAFIKGLVLTMKYFNMNGFSSDVNLTIQQAKGTASDPSQAWYSTQNGSLPDTYMTPLDWDQLYTLSAIFSYSKSNYGLSLVGRFGSGTPYTPRVNSNISNLVQNSARKPISTTFDLKSYYIFDFNSNKIQVYLNIFNLFDHLNHSTVYDDSGVSNYTSDELQAQSYNTNEYINTIEEWFDNETYYSNPRRIEMGINYEF